MKKIKLKMLLLMFLTIAYSKMGLCQRTTTTKTLVDYFTFNNSNGLTTNTQDGNIGGNAESVVSNNFHAIAENDKFIMYGGESFEEPDYFYVYNRINDTTINGFQYNQYLGIKHNYSGNNLIQSTSFIEGIQQPIYTTFFVREDADGKVYLMHNNQSIPTLVFDYSLQIGDSLTNGVVVTNIEAINYMGTMRRKYTFSNSTYDNWIEGIGFINSFYGEFFNHSSLNFQSYICASANGISQHFMPNTWNIDCNTALISGIESTSENKNTLTLHPNPASNNITISSTVAIQSLSIQTMDGKNRQAIDTKTLNDTRNMQVNISTLSNGLYLVIAHSQNGIFTQKLIKN